MLREPSYIEDTPTEHRKQGTSSRILKKIIPYVLRYPKSLWLSFNFIILASFSVLGVGMGLRYFVDYGFSQRSQENLTESILILFSIIVFMAIASFGRLYWVSQLSERVIADLRKIIFTHLLNQDLSFFESTSLGEIQSRLTTDTTLLQIVLGTSVPIALRNILIILGGLVMLILSSPTLTGLILFVIPIVLVPLLIYGKKVRNYSKLAQKKTADISIRLDETFGAIRTVRAFSRESFMDSLFSSTVEKTYQISLKRVKARAYLTSFVMILVFGGVSLVLWYGGQNVLEGQLTAGQLSAFIFYAAAVAGSAGSLSEIHGDILRAAGGVERIFEFLDLNPNLHISQNPKLLPSPLRGHIQFSKVQFSYPTRPNHTILKDVSFEAFKGETLALVGPSGAGKSTIFNLLLRLYDPTAGQILLDEISLKDLDPTQFRNQIGYVPQDPYLFSTTFYENIRFGQLDATDEQIKQAACEAYANEFIEALPQGYQTYIGEKGVTLSGGQRQRIAIARAILKNPSILLLDEATSALDEESERLIQQALSKLKHNRTTLIIAHRPSTIQKADRIVHISHGKVELLSKKMMSFERL